MISSQKYVKIYFRKILFRFKTVQTPNFYRIRKFRLCGYTLNNTCVPTGNPGLVIETAPSFLTTSTIRNEIVKTPYAILK